MNYAARRKLYKQIEKERDSKVIAFANSDRSGLETQIAQDCVNLFIDILDDIGTTKKISLILHTNGGQTSAAWRIVNLIRTFCDDFEVLIPLKALSAGTLICLGADRLVMTKQAALGPIDPSITHPLGPQILMGGMPLNVPVSVEAVRGYLDSAREYMGNDIAAALPSLYATLSNHIHPLVIGEIFRSRAQIRYLADRLLQRQIDDPEKVKKIIDFLCADSGSHDYTINRREAKDHGLSIEKPSADFYQLLKKIYISYSQEMKLLEPYSRNLMLGPLPVAAFSEVRGLVESTKGGSYAFMTEGSLVRTPDDMIAEQKTFEGWRKTA